MLKDYIDTIDKILQLIEFAKINNVEQLTIRKIERPNNSENMDIVKYVDEHTIEPIVMQRIKEYFDKNGVMVRKLVHGGTVYDYHNQNICLSNCLTINKDIEDLTIRQIIFFPDGHIRYAWQYLGAILI